MPSPRSRSRSAKRKRSCSDRFRARTSVFENQTSRRQAESTSRSSARMEPGRTCGRKHGKMERNGVGVARCSPVLYDGGRSSTLSTSASRRSRVTSILRQATVARFRSSSRSEGKVEVSRPRAVDRLPLPRRRLTHPRLRRGTRPEGWASTKSRPAFLLAAAFLHEGFDFLLGFRPRFPVALLHESGELLGAALDARDLVVGQLAPLLLRLPRELLPVARDHVSVHSG